jgi:serine phosphatase RsbU (regulator of sigma subunit)
MLRVADRTLQLADPDGYATAIAAVFDPGDRTLTLASAGHPGPLLRTLAGTVEEPETHGTMLGVAGDELATFRVPIEAGVTLVFYTDGLVEVRRDAETDGSALRDVVGRAEIVHGPQPARAVVDAVLGSDEPRDDIAVLVATFR